MSDLRPRPVDITIGGVKYEILLSLDVIDAIQDNFDMSFAEVTSMIYDNRKRSSTLKKLIAITINETAEKELITAKELGKLITFADIKPLTNAFLEAMGVSFPKSDSPNLKSE